MLKRSIFFQSVIAIALSTAISAVPPTAASERTPPPEQKLKFKPPPGGTPQGRLGAGTRNFRFAGAQPLTLLSPQGGGLAVTSRPVLAWHMNDAFTGTIAVTIRGPSGSTPLLNDLRSDTYVPGLYGVTLNQVDVDLPVGTIFIWEVALIPDGATQPEERAISFVERIDSKLSVGNRADDIVESAREFADAGIWYDALGALLVVSPDRTATTQYPAQLASLLRSIGIRSEK